MSSIVKRRATRNRFAFKPRLGEFIATGENRRSDADLHSMIRIRGNRFLKRTRIAILAYVHGGCVFSWPRVRIRENEGRTEREERREERER